MLAGRFLPLPSPLPPPFLALGVLSAADLSSPTAERVRSFGAMALIGEIRPEEAGALCQECSGGGGRG
eukprot:8950595-Pyramimonas_sp.AAC.1